MKIDEQILSFGLKIGRAPGTPQEVDAIAPVEVDEQSDGLIPLWQGLAPTLRYHAKRGVRSGM